MSWVTAPAWHGWECDPDAEAIRHEAAYMDGHFVDIQTPDALALWRQRLQSRPHGITEWTVGLEAMIEALRAGRWL